MGHKRIFGVLLFVIFSFVLFSCSDDKHTEKIEKADISDQTLVSAHSSGNISTEGPVRIRFAKEIAAQDLIDRPLEKSPFIFSPKIDGTAVWSDSRTLEFRPLKRLPQGQRYNAAVVVSQFMETPEDHWEFSFNFTAMEQAFEINMDGLRAVSRDDLSRQQFSGSIMTADSALDADVEKMLKASQDGKELNIRWTHGTDRKQHLFEIEDVTRKKDISELLLTWNGKPLGVDRKGERVFEIPSIDSFTVLQIRGVSGRTQYIEVRFSDPLQRDQNLLGLIRVQNRTDLRFTIEQNIVMVFSDGPWKGEVTVNVETGIQNTAGYRLKEPFEEKLSFEELKPQVRFTGKGVIIPTTQGLTIPIEAVNLRAITVEAVNLYEDNIPQFLQVNDLPGENEMKRVGRVIWRKTIPLDFHPGQKNKWIRYGLDIAPLIAENPEGMYNLRLSFSRNHIIFDCGVAETESSDLQHETDLTDQDYEEESSSWDYYDPDYNYWEYYQQRKNPCHPAYYRQYHDHNISVSRNILISDIGLIAKKGSNGDLFIAAADIRTAKPLESLKITVLDYQQQEIISGQTGKEGTIILPCERKPFLIVASDGDQTGYLKLSDGSALSVSHFDVSGVSLKKGLKGFIYGERGVWRPGDTLFLTFILMDNDNRLPDNHPVLFELQNPRGQVVHTIKQSGSQNGFYSFKPKTSPDALTGNWIARVKAGGAEFEKVIKIETIMPNRLKINLDFGEGNKGLSGGRAEGKISSTWLHGAPAKGLRADVKLRLSSGKTSFPGYSDYSFDDPVRKYETESSDIFEGKLNNSGEAAVKADITAKNVSPGMLTANFTTRVFEPGGTFSTDQFNIPYHPFKHYIGIRVPRGDRARDMLLTDVPHRVDIVAVSPEGVPVEEGQVEIEMYQIKWRWWWEKGEESIASYIGRSSYMPVKKEIVDIKGGRAEWSFEIQHPSWGRYLIRARDLNGEHITGSIVYIDWPGWAGRAMDEDSGGATILSFSADRESYEVGETVALTIPTGKKGRGLISFETGSRILETEWFEAGEEPVRFEFTATKEMSPNVYAHVTFIQPHMQTENDLPVRMYGVIPVKVTDPETKIKPLISAPDVLVPDETAVIEVREETGKAMTYTLAVVDEGLLDLTRFKTPDPWDFFYRREALGIKTWDIYDHVAGAYGGTLSRLLAVGGDGAFDRMEDKKANRFPPMVRFLGPFDLKAGQTAAHEIDIPQYVGSVRIMAVAGRDRAFGYDHKTAFVRKPLMILGTLPRVLGPDEEVELPVSVFALEDKIKDVSITVTSNDLLEVKDSSAKQLAFSQPDEDMVFFRLKAGNRTGIARVKITAVSNEERAEQSIELDIRNPGGPVVDVSGSVVSPGEAWQQEISFPGAAGTNEAMLEVSRIPPLNLGRRLQFLIRYPHGCVEQITSSVFPQLYLNRLVELSPAKEDEIQRNIRAGIESLRSFQTPDGGFAYWPGSREADEWSTIYAGHFLVEAEKAGYFIPSDMLGSWKIFQQNRARMWVTGTTHNSALIQAYRLYTLALAGTPELGAMNRLRERDNLPAAAVWRLAAAYQMAGQSEAAQVLTRSVTTNVNEYRELSNTFGSHIRDRAMILESLSILGRLQQAELLVQEISNELSNDKWLSTQTTAYSLIAMARYAGITGGVKDMMFDLAWNKGEAVSISSGSSVVQRDLAAGVMEKGSISIVNRGETALYSRIIVHGIPPVGKEKPVANGFAVNVRYFTLNGEEIDPVRIDQGTDFMAEVSVKNTGRSGIYEEVALTNIFPSGWEIHNRRMDESSGEIKEDFDYQDIRDDRVYTYFNIGQGQEKKFRVFLNASYLGRFYLPMVHVEAMYDNTISALVPGKWITIERPGMK